MARFQAFYSPWISWMLLSPTSFDWERRIGVSFRTLGRERCLRSKHKCIAQLSEDILKVPFDELTCRVLRRDVLGMSSNTKHLCCGNPRKLALSCADDSSFSELRNARGVQDGQWLWVQYFVYGYHRLCSGLVLYVLLPLHMISLLYNLIYPFLAFSRAGLDAKCIQIILSSIYFLLLGIALILFPTMFRYRRLIAKVPVQAINLRGDYQNRVRRWHDPDMLGVFDSIREEYTMELSNAHIEQILRNFFQSLAPLMLEILGPQRQRTLDRERLFFFRDPRSYGDRDRLTIFEVGDVLSNTENTYDIEEKALYFVKYGSTSHCGLTTPLLDNQEDECATT